MSERQLEFNLPKARAARDQGVKAVASSNANFLEVARDVAYAFASQHGSVCMDQVRRNCWLEPKHPNAWGAVFKDKRFTWSGRFVQSTIVTRHGGLQRVWVLQDPRK